MSDIHQEMVLIAQSHGFEAVNHTPMGKGFEGGAYVHFQNQMGDALEIHTGKSGTTTWTFKYRNPEENDSGGIWEGTSLQDLDELLRRYE